MFFNLALTFYLQAIIAENFAFQTFAYVYINIDDTEKKLVISTKKMVKK